MDTVNKLSKYCKENGVEDVFVVGAPKTIDNDLVGTDHCPGFGSAAKYLAATFAELERDCHVYEKEGSYDRGGYGKKCRMADCSVCSVPRQRRRRAEPDLSLRAGRLTPSSF